MPSSKTRHRFELAFGRTAKGGQSRGTLSTVKSGLANRYQAPATCATMTRLCTALSGSICAMYFPPAHNASMHPLKNVLPMVQPCATSQPRSSGATPPAPYARTGHPPRNSARSSSVTYLCSVMRENAHPHEITKRNKTHGDATFPQTTMQSRKSETHTAHKRKRAITTRLRSRDATRVTLAHRRTAIRHAKH